ncbi:MAG TPA: transcription-repair coupling factor [Chloroflexi bacterium]|nr:transcription-repair coupling factor [Chloroflexota bacterium]
MLDQIIFTIQAQAAFQAILTDLQNGVPLSNLGLHRAVRLPVLAALQKALNVPLLLISDRADYALTLADELSLWCPEVPRYFFPEPNPLFYEPAAWGATTRRDRLLALTALAARQIPGAGGADDPPPIIVAPARALMTRTLPRRDFIKATRTLKLEQIVQPDELTRSWVSLGYEPVNTVISPGQFARRGGILDIWPAAEARPTRLEFFGDEIDTLRHFDPSTQRTSETIARLLITPAREFVEREASLKAESDQPTEYHIPLLHPTPASLLDYLPGNALVLIENRETVFSTITEQEEQAVALRKDYIEDGTLPEDFPIPYLSLDQIQDSLPEVRTLELGPVSALSIVAQQAAPLLAQKFSPNPRFGGQLRQVMEHLSQQASQGDSLILVSRQISRLEELWGEQYHPQIPVKHPPQFVKGSLGDGWMLSEDSGSHLHLLTDGEIFGWRRPQPRQRHRTIAEAPESAYADFKPGDWVVHVDHGVGRFVGMVRRTIERAEREYLCLKYADSDQLFVPVHQADRLTRYVGPDGREPSPTRLGSPQWANAKSKVKEAVEEMAEELLELYAQRNVVEGHAFNEDTPWQAELEGSFPYIETDDQLRVLADVKRDMEAPRPMDRLVCGDVGFGKTEIALRAAFKAVMDGKQVALLVPTTVLAQQHYQTFRDRMAAFPVVVEMLSRFRTPQQQRKILYKLAQGGVDILIGTHRLFSSDVIFKDLGLLIIDEEQRFGVTHKESLKKMRTEVDVLTMTATPIPRTLYMTLTGVRDISTITTPPEERLPIITHVGPYNPRLVRRAVLRELERGGQIFFVHNRVQTILGMRGHLEGLVPEARIGVAHGQMPETELSTRMDEFSEGKIDILLSTSIIESGLDIPNANTLIIDRADTFGLAQLYQLRGRVGRGAQRAYAYFFKHAKRKPTVEGAERLETLAENTQLGAGFNIAMRDLEIRGAGDILGARQHGHVAAVGFHLYTRLLAESVKRLRAESGQPLDKDTLAFSVHRPLVAVELPLDTNIPPDYIPDQNIRLGLYRRMADLAALDEIEALAAEFGDRFGPLPESVSNLLYQMRIKLLAGQAGLTSISMEGNQMVLRFPEGVVPPERPDLHSRVRVGKSAYWVRFDPDGREWPGLLADILEKLSLSQSQITLPAA